MDFSYIRRKPNLVRVKQELFGYLTTITELQLYFHRTVATPTSKQENVSRIINERKRDREFEITTHDTTIWAF